jgi:hypothetical protein
MIVLSEDPESIASKIAAVMGISVYSLPKNFSLGAIAATLQPQTNPPQNSFGIWLSAPPSIDRYRAVYDAFLSRNIQLLNRPEQYAIAQQFSNIYSKLSDLAPVKSAQSWAEVRQAADLHYGQADPKGKPLGRSFRVYLYRQTILTYAYFWEVDDPLKWLTVEEEEAIFDMALKAAARLDLLFVAIDIGQQVCDNWTIVGVSDAQFCLLNQTPMISFWGELEKIFSAQMSG